MLWRFYLDRKLDGPRPGEHSRVLDIEADTEEAARAHKDFKLKTFEEVGHVATLWQAGQDAGATLTVERRNEVVEAIAADLAASMGVPLEEARALAEGAVARANL